MRISIVLLALVLVGCDSEERIPFSDCSIKVPYGFERANKEEYRYGNILSGSELISIVVEKTGESIGGAAFNRLKNSKLHGYVYLRGMYQSPYSDNELAIHVLHNNNEAIYILGSTDEFAEALFEGCSH